MFARAVTSLDMSKRRCITVTVNGQSPQWKNGQRFFCRETLNKHVPSLLGLAFQAVYNRHDSRDLADLERLAAVSATVRDLEFFVDPPPYSIQVFSQRQCAQNLLNNTRMMHESRLVPLRNVNGLSDTWICSKRAKRVCHHPVTNGCNCFFIIWDIEEQELQ